MKLEVLHIDFVSLLPLYAVCITCGKDSGRVPVSVCFILELCPHTTLTPLLPHNKSILDIEKVDCKDTVTSLYGLYSYMLWFVTDYVMLMLSCVCVCVCVCACVCGTGIYTYQALCHGPYLPSIT